MRTMYEDLPRDEKTGAVQADAVEFPIRFSLLRPLETTAGKRDALEMREPTVLDLEVANRQKEDMARTIALVSALTETSPDEVRSMGTRDFARLAGAVAVFL